MVFKFKSLPSSYYNLGEAAAFAMLALGEDAPGDVSLMALRMLSLKAS